MDGEPFDDLLVAEAGEDFAGEGRGGFGVEFFEGYVGGEEEGEGCGGDEGEDDLKRLARTLVWTC